MIMYCNIIKSYRDVVAVCDKELLGKTFEKDNFQLNVKENFYKGEEKTAEEVLKILETMAYEDATFNLVGERVVNAGLKVGVINENSIAEIGGVKFALVLL